MLKRLTGAVTLTLLVLISGCGGEPLVGYQLEYRIIGGKPSAPQEQLTIDCKTLSVQFIRQSTFNTQPSESLTASLSTQQCQQLETLIETEQLCRAPESQQGTDKLVDGNTYSVICYQHKPAINRIWYRAQSPFQEWHQYTRQLIDVHFPKSYRYP